MNVTYTPANGDAQTWVFNPKLVKAAMAEVIEKRAELRYDAWVDAVLAGSARARRVLLWHLTCLTHSHLRFEDTPDFAMGELVVERDLDELLEFRGVIENWSGDDDIRRAGLIEVDVLIADERAKGAVELGKATSPIAVLATPSTSPLSSI